MKSRRRKEGLECECRNQVGIASSSSGGLPLDDLVDAYTLYCPSLCQLADTRGRARKSKKTDFCLCWIEGKLTKEPLFDQMSENFGNVLIYLCTLL